MDKVLAQGAARPAAAEKRFVAIEFFLTDLAVPGFNSQQHRLPVPASVSNAHDTEYSGGVWGEQAVTLKFRDDRCTMSVG
jgi:hypothetical protein